MTDTKTKEPKPQGYFAKLIDQIRARGLPVPTALAGEAQPLALSTRADLPPWCELNGYDDDAFGVLNEAIGVHTRSASYLKALVADLAVRVDLDGCPVSPVSELDRHSAALGLYLKERKDEARRAKPADPVAAPASSPSPIAAKAPASVPAAPASAPAKRPIISLAGAGK